MRYVVGDLEEVGAELGRRAREVADWLDGVAAQRSSPGPGAGSALGVAAGAPSGDAADVGRGELACCQALSAVEQRLRAASRAVLACLEELRMVDADVGRRMGQMG
jgi:hypothetical protein